MEGICPRCGSIHLHGTCSRLPEAKSSSARSTFGPWMAALRQRRPPSSSPADLQRKVSTTSNQSGSAPRSVPGDGWQVPTKIARQRLPKFNQARRSPGAGPTTEHGEGSAGVPAEGGVPAGIPMPFTSLISSDLPVPVEGGCWMEPLRRVVDGNPLEDSRASWLLEMC